FFTAGLAISFFAENIQAKGFTWQNQIEQIKAGLRIGWQNQFIRWSTGILALGFAMSYTFSNIYQPYLVGLGFPVKTFSMILPVMFVAQALGGLSFGRLIRLGEKKLFTIGVIGIALLIGFLGILNAKAVLLLIFAYMFLDGLNRPLLSAYSNRHLESET